MVDSMLILDLAQEVIIRSDPPSGIHLGDPTSWLTALTAVVVAYIAWQQHRNVRDRLRMDLFEKRLVLYRAARDLISTALDQGGAPSTMFFDFVQLMNEAEFLFGEEVFAHLEVLARRASQWRQIGGALAKSTDMPHSDRAALESRDREMLEWFMAQSAATRKVFEPYLGFAHIS
jgi:hypothetical protein